MPLPYLSRPARAEGAPLLVYLHGLGEVGGETATRARRHGPWSDVLYDPAGAYGPDTAAALDRFHVVGFHLPDGDWDGTVLAREIDRYLHAHPGIDPRRLHLTGVSRGGRGVLRLAIARRRAGQPVSTVAAFCPAGGADAYVPADLDLLRGVPVHLFHCPEDEVVPFEGTASLHRGLGSDGSRLRIVHRSELADPAGPHNCWTQFYGQPSFYAWLEAPAADPANWPHLPARR